MRAPAVSLAALTFLLASLSPALAQAPTVSYVRPVSWQQSSEQEWIVSDIATTISMLANRGRATPIGAVKVSALPQDGSMPSFTVEAAGKKATLTIRDHLWAPVNYAPLAAQWIAQRKRTSAASSPSGILSALTTPRVSALEAVNLEIGRRLATDAPARVDYDDAALLVGVLALRESPGPFGDTRRLLSKMTAYLAVAQAFQPAPTRTGEIAELIQLALIDRQQDALDRLAKWEASSPSALDRVWIRSLKMRVTGDWRVLENPAEASLLERLEYVRALDWRRGVNAVLDFLDASHPEDIADWARLVEGRPLSVESSTRFSEHAVTFEVRDAAVVWSKVSGRAFEPSEASVSTLIGQLNEEGVVAGDADGVPIDWATWAASFQRALAAHAVLNVEHESYWYGRKDEARRVAAGKEELLGRLTLFPLAKLQYALDDAQYASAMKDIVGLMLRKPELLTSANWMKAIELRNGRVPSGITPQAVWFTTLVPAGTAHDAGNRVYTYRRTNHLTLETLRALRQVAPYTRYLLEEEMRWRYPRPQEPPLDEYRRVSALLAAYDSVVVADLVNAARNDPTAYVPLAEHLCRLEASRCSLLAKYLADRDRDDEAAAVYQKWIDTGRDEVSIANGSSWLVTYYYTHGQESRAVAIADDAAAVYSYGGLLTKARLLERMGRYKEAEVVLKQAGERYDKTIDLAAFYFRWSKAFGDPGIKSAGDALAARVFPSGMQRVEANLFGPPRDGVRVTATGARGEKAGFHVGDVIVAVDGIGVHNQDQLTMAWHMDAGPQISFLVWTDGKFTTIQAAIRESWTSGTFANYRASARKP
jgi:tetratricopeptide (TPR) repeat protein